MWRFSWVHMLMRMGLGAESVCDLDTRGQGLLLEQPRVS